MFTQIFRAFIFTAFIAAFFCCKKDSEIISAPPTPTKDTLKTSLIFNFEASANNVSLQNNSTWFTLANGDSFTVTKFNYYISNIKLTRDDGFIFSETESYHLNKHFENITSFTVNNVPEGKYTLIEFMIGVDSLRNHSGAQTGALDVGNGMFWEWNTGYIFFKIEGECKTENMTEKNEYAYHISTDNILKKCAFNLSTPVIAKKNKQASVIYKAIVDSVFGRINFDDFKNVTGGKQAGVIADNYKKMFIVSKVEN